MMSRTQNAALGYLELEVIEFEKFESKKFDCDKNPNPKDDLNRSMATGKLNTNNL